MWIVLLGGYRIAVDRIMPRYLFKLNARLTSDELHENLELARLRGDFDGDQNAELLIGLGQINKK